MRIPSPWASTCSRIQGLCTESCRRILMKMSSRRALLERGSVAQYRPHDVDPPTHQGDEDLRVSLALMGPRSVRRPRKKRAMYSISVAKYRPHRPHRYECSDLQDFLAVGTTVGDRPSEDSYRPPHQIPPADRPPGNETFCGAFSSPLVIVVGAVATFPAFTYVLLIAPRVSFCWSNSDAPGEPTGIR
jgi:hypothetical protein